MPRGRAALAKRSRIALNAVNFFVAQLTGLGSPFLTSFLRERGWDYDALGVAAAMAGLGVLLMQTPAGLLVDRWTRPRRILAASALAVGACYATLPLLPHQARLATCVALFASGLAQSFFAPLLAGLALGIAGHARLDRLVGQNQAWNNLGTVSAAALAIVVLERNGLSFIFGGIGAVAVLAALSVLAIPPGEVDRVRECGGREHAAPLRALLRDERVLVLVASTTLLHLAIATSLPFVALRVKDLNGSDARVAALVLATQATMAPVAVLAGRLCQRFGRRPVFAVAFLLEPVRLLACGVVRDLDALVALQALGGVSAGIFGVAIVLATADLARGTGHFHGLTGASRTALALASVAGPVLAGHLLGRGYGWTFGGLAASAAVGALLFLARMPETAPLTSGGRAPAPSGWRARSRSARSAPTRPPRPG